MTVPDTPQPDDQPPVRNVSRKDLRRSLRHARAQTRKAHLQIAEVVAQRDALAATLTEVEAHRDRALSGLVELGKQLTDADTDRDALAATLANRHRRVYETPPSWRWWACSCGVKFSRPDERDDHVIKANEATWESAALLSDTPDTQERT